MQLGGKVRSTIMSHDKNMKTYTEKTIKEPGWYFVYHTHPEIAGREKFMEIDEDCISNGWLQCRQYAGTYIGPIAPPKIEEEEIPFDLPPAPKFNVGETVMYNPYRETVIIDKIHKILWNNTEWGYYLGDGWLGEKHLFYPQFS